MKFGISTFVNDDTIDTVSLARAIEDRGFHSLAIAEHTHIPASRETAYPLGGELPKIYYRTLDAFVTLAAAAAVTTSIELITGIALLIQRAPEPQPRAGCRPHAAGRRRSYHPPDRTGVPRPRNDDGATDQLRQTHRERRPTGSPSDQCSAFV
jgi:hypothetical protein